MQLYTHSAQFSSKRNVLWCEQSAHDFSLLLLLFSFYYSIIWCKVTRLKFFFRCFYFDSSLKTKKSMIHLFLFNLGLDIFCNNIFSRESSKTKDATTVKKCFVELLLLFEFARSIYCDTFFISGFVSKSFSISKCVNHVLLTWKLTNYLN